MAYKGGSIATLKGPSVGDRGLYSSYTRTSYDKGHVPEVDPVNSNPVKMASAGYGSSRDYTPTRDRYLPGSHRPSEVLSSARYRAPSPTRTSTLDTGLYSPSYQTSHDSRPIDRQFSAPDSPRTRARTSQIEERSRGTLSPVSDIGTYGGYTRHRDSVPTLTADSRRRESERLADRQTRPLTYAEGTPGRFGKTASRLDDSLLASSRHELEGSFREEYRDTGSRSSSFRSTPGQPERRSGGDYRNGGRLGEPTTPSKSYGTTAPRRYDDLPGLDYGRGDSATYGSDRGRPDMDRPYSVLPNGVADSRRGEYRPRRSSQDSQDSATYDSRVPKRSVEHDIDSLRQLQSTYEQQAHRDDKERIRSLERARKEDQARIRDLEQQVAQVLGTGRAGEDMAGRQRPLSQQSVHSNTGLERDFGRMRVDATDTRSYTSHNSIGSAERYSPRHGGDGWEADRDYESKDLLKAREAELAWCRQQLAAKDSEIKTLKDDLKNTERQWEARRQYVQAQLEQEMERGKKQDEALGEWMATSSRQEKEIEQLQRDLQQHTERAQMRLQTAKLRHKCLTDLQGLIQYCANKARGLHPANTSALLDLETSLDTGRSGSIGNRDGEEWELAQYQEAHRNIDRLRAVVQDMGHDSEDDMGCPVQ
eukprot:comp14919_c0_seq1/m.11477 comp14919_c0_seq1/g.11477  ORF comp14919_c0_seq1/g.11477 comp14919_c0_seq1/m.11477 type:complete len:648 (-) comp14919_c0_seq1:755-2698(-)